MKLMHKTSKLSFCSVLLLSVCFFMTNPVLGQDSAEQKPTLRKHLDQFGSRKQLKSFLKKKNLKGRNINLLDIQNQQNSEKDNFDPQSTQQLINIQMPKMRSSRTNVAATSDEALTQHNSRLLIEGVPASFDWSKQVQLSSVKSIGYCAASWAFAATSFFQADSIINLNQSSTIDLSEQYLISCDQISTGCQSGFLQGPIDLAIRKGGIPTQANYAYNPQGTIARNICKTNNFFKTFTNYRMSYYDMYDQEKIKKIILKKPVSIAICGQDLLRYQPGQTEESKILKCHPSHTLLNHAVLLVGYTQLYWIIKNEWGSKWGLNGYAYISRNQVEDCCIGQQLHTTGERTNNCQVEGCEICVEQYTCYKCQAGKYVYHIPFTGVQSCQTCNIKNCQQCFDYYQYCSYCIDGYAINQTSGKCQISPIEGCNHIVNGYCGQCHKGFILSSDLTKCTADCSVKYCRKCSDGPCSDCLTGYSLITVNGTQKCQPNNCTVTNCDLCYANGTCAVCSQYMLMNETSCINTCKITNCLSCKNKSSICDICVDGKSFNYWTETCELFNVTNCAIHLFGQCFQCRPGHKFDSSKRLACLQICEVDNCSTCVKTDTTVCLTCQPGYALSTVGIDTYCTSYPCNITNCTACDINVTTCLVCKTSFHIYNVTSRQCEIQCSKTNCQICLNSARYCQKCKAGYVVEYDSGTCYVANYSHCTLVGFDTGNFECWQCEEKYIVNIATWKGCLLDCYDDNCELCDTDTLLICQKCYNGYSQTFVNGKLTCILITSLIPKCTLVSLNQTYCYKCNDYYNWNNVSACVPYATGCKDLCMYCPVPGSGSEYCQCQTGFAYDLFTNVCGMNPFDDKCLWIGLYGGSMICFKCIDGYILSPNYKGCVGQCIANNCTKCFDTANSYCQICDPGFYVNTSSWKCSICSISNCKVCDARFCFDCMVGYQLSPDGSKCLPYVCEGDLAFNGFSCSCPIGTYFTNNSCLTCLQNCKWCDAGGCVECQSGYFKQNGQCIACIVNCKQCTTQTDCKQCNEKFFYEQTSQKCISVGFNRTYIIVNGLTVQCLPGCVECTSNGSCTLCTPGYSFSPLTNQCVPCEGRCKSCYYNIPEACLSCDPGYYFDELRCQPCSNNNCIECLTDPKICTKCAVGFALQNKTCVNCQTNCLECNYKGQCLKCSPGFSVNDLRMCEQCVGDCKQCNVYHLDRCETACEDKEYLGDDSVCHSCPSSCKTCLSATNCTRCQIGYILRDDMCISPCQQGCYRCSAQNSLVCQQCFAGYFLSEAAVCTIDLSCNLTKSCIGCPLGWSLLNGVCSSCTAGQNCSQCSAVDPKKCLQCVDGFYLSNKTCSSCPQQCVLCQRQNLCTLCSDGFYMIKIESNESGRCSACDPKCMRCDIRPTQCLSCSNSSYELTVSQKCISKERVEVEITIDIDIDLFSSISRQVREDLAACIGENYRNRTDLVLIKTISSGSTHLNVQIATPEDQDLVTVLQSVKLALSQDNQLGGVSVISVNKIKILGSPDVDPNQNITNPEAQKNSNNNLAIILGVTIPSLVIILLVIIGCVLKKRSQQKANAVVNEDSFNESFSQKSQKQRKEKRKVNKKLPPISTVKHNEVNEMFREAPDQKSHQNMFVNLYNQSVENAMNPFETTPTKGIRVKDSQDSEFVTLQQQNDSSNIVLRDGQDGDSQSFRPINEQEGGSQGKVVQNERIQLESSESNCLQLNERNLQVQQVKQQVQNVLEVDDI